MERDETQSLFKAPPNRYRLAAFWFWNHWLEDEELRWQIREMNAKAVGGFVMHARHVLLTPHLSEDWFRRVGSAIEEASRLGMEAYVYD